MVVVRYERIAELMIGISLDVGLDALDRVETARLINNTSYIVRGTLTHIASGRTVDRDNLVGTVEVNVPVQVRNAYAREAFTLLLSCRPIL